MKSFQKNAWDCWFDDYSSPQKMKWMSSEIQCLVQMYGPEITSLFRGRWIRSFSSCIHHETCVGWNLQFGYQGSVAYEKLQANSFGQGVNRQETRWSWKRYCPWIRRQWKWLYRIIIKIVMDDKSTNKWTESHWRIRPQHTRWRAEVRFIREPHCRFKQDYASYWVVLVGRIGLWSMLLTVSSWMMMITMDHLL